MLIGLGLDELSMSAVTVPAVKQRVTEIDTAEASKRASKIVSASTKDEVVNRLTTNGEE